jgi:hypothetical protein
VRNKEMDFFECVQNYVPRKLSVIKFLRHGKNNLNKEKVLTEGPRPVQTQMNVPESFVR